LDDNGVAINRARIFAGHAGWSPGQLEEEVDEDAWLIEDAEEEHVFYEGDLWGDLLRSRGGPWVLVATMPDDPTLN
jgi:putative transcriptional regulator